MKSISVNDYCLWGVDGILRQRLQSVCQFSMALWDNTLDKRRQYKLFLWQDSNPVLVKTWHVSFWLSNYHPSPHPKKPKILLYGEACPQNLIGCEVFYTNTNTVLHHGAGCYSMTWLWMTWHVSVRTIMLIDECTFSCVEAMPAVALLRGLLQHWGWVRSPIHCIASQHPLLGNPTPPLPDQS